MGDADIRKYMEAKALMSQLESKIERYRRRILDSMKEMDVKKISTGDYTATIRTMRSEHIYKKDVPSDIWNRYKKESECTQLFVKERKKIPKSRDE